MASISLSRFDLAYIPIHARILTQIHEKQRYISPIISPPTPPQLQQDKEQIDAEFARAFALLDQLSADTATLKSAEEARTERLDAALREVESVVSELKAASRRHEDEGRLISEEVRNLKEGIPKALDGTKEGSDKRLKELGVELRSLKTLMANRLGTPAPSQTPLSSQVPSRPAGTYLGAGNVLGSSTDTTSALPREKEENTSTSNTVNGTPNETPSGASNPITAASASIQSLRREGNPNPFLSGGARRAIPEWQMAASKAGKSSTSLASTVGEGSSSDANEGESQSGAVA
jgi:peroxin-14